MKIFLTDGKDFRKNRGQLRKKVFIILMLLYPLANFLLFYVYININSVLMAFQKTDKSFNSVFVGLDNFKHVYEMIVAEGSLLLYIKNSLFFFFTSFIIGFPLNIIFAYLFYIRMRGTPVLRFCIMLPAMISGVVTAMLFSKFADNALPIIFKRWFDVETASLLLDQRFNKWFLLVYMLGTGFSYNVLIYTNAANAIDDAIFEAANIDGANNLQILLKVVVPMIYPTMTTFVVIGVAGLFAGDAGAYLFFEYNGPESITTTGYYMFLKTKSPSNADYSLAAAMGIFFTLISFPLTMLTRAVMERYDPMKDV